MKISIFLLTLLSFIRTVLCLSSNVSCTADQASECPWSLFRRKRANGEYTRWRASVVTTPQFIVKVLDDEVTTTDKQIVAVNNLPAVNILPAAKRRDMIIVGGAMVPPAVQSSVSPEENQLVPLEYTRFMPPTNVATRMEGELFLAPVYTSPSGRDDDEPVKPIADPRLYESRYPPIPFAKNPNVLRDESPPAGPHFIAPAALPRQYAPITPIVFHTRATESAMTPYRFDQQDVEEAVPRSPYSHTTTPVPISDEFIVFTPYPEDVVKITRTPTPTNEFLGRTTGTPRTTHIFNVDHHDYVFRNYTDEPVARKSNINKDSETFFNNLVLEHDADHHTYRNKSIDYRIEDYRNEDNNVMHRVSEPEIDGRKVVYDDFGYTPKDSPAKVVYDDNEYTPRYTSASTLVYDDVMLTGIGQSSKPDTYDEVYTPSSTKDMYDEVYTPSSTTDMYDEDIYTSTNSTAFVYLDAPSSTSKPERKQNNCSLIKLRKLNFNAPRTLPEINAQLKMWAEESPVARWVDITDKNLTAMENPIYMMIVDDPSNGQIDNSKHTVMIVAGIQGRDHHAVASAMYLLYQLIERTDSHTDLLSQYRFWIIPVFNPDGYDYAMTFPHRREWTKNLRQSWDTCKGRESCKACDTQGIRCTIQPCYGINLDRNFEYQWIPDEKLRQEHPCGMLYAGVRQLSEAETKALTHYLHEHQPSPYIFIALKEGDVLGIMYPYSHTKKKRAKDHIYRQRASRAAAAAYSIGGRPYVAGQTSEFLPLYAGGIEDWIDGHLGIDHTYTISLFRPSDSYDSRVITERAVHEAYAAIDTLLLQPSKENRRQTPAPDEAPVKLVNQLDPQRITPMNSAAKSLLSDHPYYTSVLLAFLLS